MITKTPILVLIFNRPEKVRALIASLLKVKPTHIYVSADGPRAHVETDKTRCQEARDLFENLPWECEVHTNFSDVNLGCKKGPVKGITWFFQNVESGIILEDDCIPGPSFFTFCTTLLHRYKDDKEIMHISGNNFQTGILRGDGNYYFSLYTHSWGWATWRRAWEKYQIALEQFAKFDETNAIKEVPISSQAQSFWIKNFRQTIKGTDSWDSLWLYTVWFHKGLALIPNKNLVSNIGFDKDATHTFTSSPATSLPSESLAEIIHPSIRKLNLEADEYTFRTLFYCSVPKRVYLKIRDIISKYL